MFLGLLRPLSPAKQMIFNISVFVSTLLAGAVSSLFISTAISPTDAASKPRVVMAMMAMGALFAGLGWLLGFLCGKATGTQEAAESVTRLQGEQRTEAPR